MLHRKGYAYAAVALSSLFMLVMASAASAAPVEGPAGEAFYTAPPLPEGPHGTLVEYRPTTVNLNVELPSVKAWTVLYKSENELGEANPVTGTVIVPSAAWNGSGSRPVVSYAEGTQGLGHQCAPSLAIVNGTEYDGGAIIASLEKGYAVAITDYPGYTTGAIPEYTAGMSEGHSVLDAVTAAQQVPGSGISSSAPVVLWGYSQGGQAAGWAAQLASSYSPELHVAGTAAGGTPANLLKLAEFSEGGPANAFGIDGFVGLLQAYRKLSNPEMAENELLTTAGKEVVAKLKHECALESLRNDHGLSFKSITKSGKTLVELAKSNIVFESALREQSLGTTAPSAPVYHYHGLEDEFVNVSQDVELHNEWCALGATDDFKLYPGDHLLTDPTSIPEVMKWIGERLAGKAAPSTCGLHEPGAKLPPNARLTPETGDLIIPIPEWQVSGSVTAKKLGIALKIPAGATFSSEADVTAETLTASLFVPPIKETLSLFGLIPVTLEGSLTQTGPVTGKVSLSNSAVLTVSATGGAILATKSLKVLGLTIPLECHTATPVELPLSFSRSANALSTGSISESATVTIPQFTGCGIFSPLTSLLLSGPGNPINLAVSPPPPISW